MKDIAIYGAGGFGREIACLIHKINKVSPTWNLIGFFDDGKDTGSKTEYGKVLGGINELNSYSQELSIAMAIANPKALTTIIGKITSKFISFPNIISPDITFLDEKNISLGQGNVFCTGCLISCNVHIGSFNIFNGFITIGHDTIINDYNVFMPAVRISGGITIGSRNFLGVSSVILQYIKIGNDTVIGASSLILRKTKDGETYVGNPAKIIKY